MQNNNKKLYWIYTIRPYSWIGVISIAILANVIANGGIEFNFTLTEDALIALGLWIMVIFLIEYLQRFTDERIKTSLPFIASSIVLLLILYFKNPYTIILLVFGILIGSLYGFKTKDLFISRFSFMFRGFLEVLLFSVILFFHRYYDIYFVFPVILIIYFVTISRNLIGDIRDVECDQFTFPKKYGIKASYLIAGVLIIFSILLSKSLSVSLPLIVYLFLLALIRDAYFLHRFFVLTTIFFFVNFTLYFLNNHSFIFFSNLLFIGTLLNFTYDLTPRKSNKLERDAQKQIS